MSARLLVFGADGQLGRELQRAALPEGLSLTALNRREADITDPAAVRDALARARPAVVINAAAYTAVDAAEDEPEAAFAVNRDGPAHLAAACAAAGVPLIHVSTDYVFDGGKGSPYTEADPVAPLGVYGRGKEAGERAVRAALEAHVILRTAWVHGAHGRNFVKTMLRVGAERARLTVVDDQHGNPTAAADLAAGCITVARRLLHAPPPEAFGTFHLAGSGATTWCGFARAIFAEARELAGGPCPEVVAIASDQWPTRAPRPADARLDCGRIARVYGLALPPWRDSLRPVLAELLKEDRRA